MSWYGIDYSGRRPVYMFGNYSRIFPKADPNNKVYRDHIANEVREAKRNSLSDYVIHKSYSGDERPDTSFDDPIKRSVKAAYANQAALRAGALRASASPSASASRGVPRVGALGVGLGALGAYGALRVGLAARSLYRRHQERRAARLAAQQEQ